MSNKTFLEQVRGELEKMSTEGTAAEAKRQGRPRKPYAQIKRFCVKFDAFDYERLTEQSAKERRPMAQILRDALNDYVNKTNKRRK